MKRIGQAVPTHAVAFSGCLLFAIYHRIKRFEARFQIRQPSKYV